MLTPMTSKFLNPVVRPVAGWAVLLATATLAYGQTSVVLNGAPTRVAGHVKVSQGSGAPNLVEGRELNGPQSIAVDTSVSPPIVYVSDTGNNRVLAFKNGTGLSKGNFADKVIGQRDLLTTNAQGPGSGLSSGLNQPTGITVDKNGNLYVIDSGNQRILRYPKPMSQTSDLLPVDLVIGQRAVSSGTQPNEGSATPSAKTIFVAVPSNGLNSSLALDPSGNLWVADTQNNRVLRFPAQNLTANTVEPTADVVLGQNDFATRSQPNPPQNTPAALYKGSTLQPTAVAVDSQGRLYVADTAGRVMYYPGPFNSGVFASRILGLQIQIQGQPAIAVPNNISLGLVQGLLTINDTLLAADTGFNRIVRYDKPESWPAETATAPSPAMRSVVGQSDFLSGKPNRGEKDATAIGLSAPTAMSFTGSELWVADTGNNRAVAFTASGDLFPSASRVIGQVDFSYFGVNLVEGREIFVYAGSNNGFPVGGSGVVIDRNSNPPRLYLADSLNNRVLGFADARNVKPGDKADLVIGQTDFFRTVVNSPTADRLLPTDSGLFGPTGLAVDANGNLWVSDTGNGRLLRFPSPFSQGSLVNQRATKILGQSDYFTKVTDAGVANMANPYGIAILLDGSVLASDVSHNRVLLFRRPSGGDFNNGQSAAVVYGQPDFTQTGSGTATSINRFNRPTHIAVDTDDRLYVADNGTGRVLVFTRPPPTGTNLNSTIQITGFSGVSGVTISPLTGELWVADTFNNRVLRFPQYDTLALNPQQSTFTVSSPVPLAVGLDAFDNLLVVDGTNELAFFYQAIVWQNAANYSTRALAPGMLAYLYRFGRPFDSNWNSAKDPTAKPWSTVVSDVQVLMNGAPTPVYELVPTRVDFMVPMNAPQSDTAEFLVLQKSTGQVLGVGNLPMNQADPGLYAAAGGAGQLAATNEDGSVNGPGNGAVRGKTVTLYGTGEGFVANAPPDGQPASGALSTPVKPRVVFAGVVLSDADVLYSGLTSFPAGWQINIKVPDPQAAPGQANIVTVTMYDIPANRGPNGQITTTIFVK